MAESGHMADPTALTLRNQQPPRPGQQHPYPHVQRLGQRWVSHIRTWQIGASCVGYFNQIGYSNQIGYQRDRKG